MDQPVRRYSACRDENIVPPENSHGYDVYKLCKEVGRISSIQRQIQDSLSASSE
uniref:Uncharacterized protein n=1 Tax=Solanum tuberosum TaxID=4113 RepID=M0ZZ68_SOLTU